jgi:hypothetical protein
MLELTLTRKNTSDEGTFGELTSVHGVIFKTGELPWRDNKPSLSSVPRGHYPVKWLWSPKHNRNIYHVVGVQGRDLNGQMANIEIHAGNYCGDVTKGLKSNVLGCILIGNGIGTLGNQEAVLDSQSALSHFETLMNYEEFMLTITEAYPA